MKVCLLSNTPVAGFKTFLISISRCLTKNGCDVTVVNLNKENSIFIEGTEQLIYELSDHIKNIALSPGEKIESLIERILFRIKKTDSPKSILKHNLFHSQLKALHAARNCERLDLSSFDCVISCEEILCNYFLSYGVIAKKKIGYIHPDYLKTPYNRRIEKKVLSKLDYICATSLANAESIQRALPSLRNRIIGVPNPLDVEMIIRKAEMGVIQAFEKEIINLITVCRLDNTYKALDRLLCVAKKMRDTGDKFVWRIVGGGEYWDIMLKFIEQNGLKDCVIMLGEIDNPVPLVKASDLFVLQSYSEGYPMSVLESLAVNTPVLITDYPSSQEQVENGVTGYIVKNDFDSVYEQLHHIVNNRTELAWMENNLQNSDKSKFENINSLLGIIR